MMKDMPTANHVWGSYLRSLGFRRHKVHDHITVNDFCRMHPHGVYVLALTSHVIAVIDGIYYDTWNSGEEYPIFYWTREE